VPKIAIAPLLIIWLGAGLLPKILIVAVTAFFP
jgi:NitT/TauT family transport system permease protein